jgi:hypothetical protein
MQAQSKSKGRPMALHNLNLGTGWRSVVNATRRLLYLLAGATVFLVQEAGWTPAPVWKCVEKGISVACTGVRTPNRPANSKSLYKAISYTKVGYMRFVLISSF